MYIKRSIIQTALTTYNFGYKLFTATNVFGLDSDTHICCLKLYQKTIKINNKTNEFGHLLVVHYNI